jgi:hypothetical protein
MNFKKEKKFVSFFEARFSDSEFQFFSVIKQTKREDNFIFSVCFCIIYGEV